MLLVVCQYLYICTSKASKLSTGLLVGVRGRAGVAGSLELARELAREFVREPLSSIVLRFVRAARLPERAPRRS